MEENGNFLHLSGVLTDNPVYGHDCLLYTSDAADEL